MHRFVLAQLVAHSCLSYESSKTPSVANPLDKNRIHCKKLASCTSQAAYRAVTFVSVVFLILSALFPHGVAFAQNVTSSISGTVADPTGAVIPNAKIDVRENATGRQFTATTDSRGAYTITNVQPGSYTISANAAGFEAETQSNVTVDPNIGRQVNFALKTGSATTTVTVQADVNALQTESAAVGQLVTSEQVKSIALNGRNPIYLSQLEAGITRNAPLTSFNFTPDFSVPQISGARNDEIMVTLDGAPMIRTRGNGTTTGVADVDSVSQMQILSSTYPAQYGGTFRGHSCAGLTHRHA